MHMGETQMKVRKIQGFFLSNTVDIAGAKWCSKRIFHLLFVVILIISVIETPYFKLAYTISNT